MPLYKKVNFLGKNKSCCEHVIKNFRNDCAWSSVTILVLEISAGTGHTNRKVCSVQRGKRLTKGDYRMKTIRTIYLYGVSGKTTKHMIVKYHLENRLFLSIGPNSNFLEIETTLVIWNVIPWKSFLPR